MTDVVADLRAQVEDLRTLASGLDEAGFATPSACPGWSVSDVLLHLAQTNDMAIASVQQRLMEAGDLWAPAREGVSNVDDLADGAVAAERGPSGAEVFRRWSDGAEEMVAAFETTDPAARVQWVVGQMAARSLATTRLAETWIHTGDIYAGLGIEQPPTDRTWHITRLVHRTLPYAFTREGRDAPGPVRFEVRAAESDDVWIFGDEHAPTVVQGPALDLCHVAGQRADAADTALSASGPDAEGVLLLMRTFA